MKTLWQIVSGKPYGYAVDWWAYGVTLYTLLHANFPFGGSFRDFKIKYLPIILFSRFYSNQGRDCKELIYQVGINKEFLISAISKENDSSIYQFEIDVTSCFYTCTFIIYFI